MTRKVKVAFAIIIIPLLLLAATWTGKVVGVSDGDTIKVMQDGKAVKIRLHGIDTPEKNQPFGQKAKKFTSELVFGKDVRVVVKDTDRYGRTVAEVFVNDSVSLNQELVRAGLAWWYKRYAPGDLVLKKLEEDARKAGRGLWSMGKQVPPWEWRKGKKKGSGKKVDGDRPRCQAMTKKGSRCKRKVKQGKFCWQHGG